MLQLHVLLNEIVYLSTYYKTDTLITHTSLKRTLFRVVF